jgi:hypothetical protein
MLDGRNWMFVGMTDDYGLLVSRFCCSKTSIAALAPSHKWKGRPVRGGLSSKTSGLRDRAGALNQARISPNAGILVTAAVDRGWWLYTGSPPFWLLSQGG